MLLTVGVVNLLSHVAPLFTGQDVSLHLNKFQPVEVIRHWIGESNTSAFQQQQFQHQLKMLLSGGGEGGGVASPIASRGNGGVSKDDQLPRASRQSISDSADEQSSVPHLSNTPSKRIRSSSDDITESNVGISQRLSKKARLSHNSGQRPSEEQEEVSQQVGKLNISQDFPARSAAFQGSYDEGQISSKQASQEMQKTPSFDDLLTKAIQAVNPQVSSPVKKNTSETQPTSQRTSAPAATVNQTQAAIPVMPVEQLTPVLTPSVQTVPSTSTIPVEITVSNDGEMVSDLATQPTSQRTSAPAAAVNQTPAVIPVMPVEKPTPTPTAQAPTLTPSAPAPISVDPAPQVFRSTKTPPLIESITRQVAPIVIPEPMDTETISEDLMTEALSSAAKEAMKRLTNLFNSIPEQVRQSKLSSEDVVAPSSADSAFKQSTSQQTPSETAESIETETTTASTKETTTQPDPLASADQDRQKHQRKMGSVAEQLRKKFNQRQENSSQNTQNSEEAKSGPSASADQDRQEHQQKMGSVAEQLRKKFNQRQENSSQNTQNSKETKSDPSASADQDRQEHQQKMGSVAEQLRKKFNQRQENSSQNTQNSKETKSDPSASVDPALQQQRRSMFEELKGFQFNKGQKKKSQAKQKPEEAKPDPVLQKKTNNMVDELKSRLSQRQVQSKQKSEDVKSDSSTSQNEFNRFGLRKTSRFDELVHGKAPESKPLESNQMATTPQKPVVMKKAELGKKSSLATIATPEAQINELILKQERLERSIEWHKKNILKYNPKDHLAELRVIKGKIALLRRQIDREKKAVKPIASSSVSKVENSTAQSKIQVGGEKETSNPRGHASLSSLFSTTQGNLLEGIKIGVELKHVDKKAKQIKKPTNDLERALFSRRQVMEDDNSDDDSDDESNGDNRPFLQDSEHQPEEEKKAGVGTPPPPPSSPPPPPLIHPEVKENKRSILQSIQNFRRGQLSSPEEVNVSSTTTTPTLKKKEDPKDPLSAALGRSFNNFLSRFNLHSDDSAEDKKVDEEKQNLAPSTGSSDSDDDDWD